MTNHKTQVPCPSTQAAGLAWDDKSEDEAPHFSKPAFLSRPFGTSLAIRLARHYVPGYWHAVPSGLQFRKASALSLDSGLRPSLGMTNHKLWASLGMTNHKMMNQTFSDSVLLANERSKLRGERRVQFLP